MEELNILLDGGQSPILCSGELAPPRLGGEANFVFW